MTHAPEPSGFLSERAAPHSPWQWRLHDAAGAEVPGERTALGTRRFPSQGDAETWVGEWWQDLVEEGVDAVTLLEGDRVVYGPMSLRPA